MLPKEAKRCQLYPTLTLADMWTAKQRASLSHGATTDINLSLGIHKTCRLWAKME